MTDEPIQGEAAAERESSAAADPADVGAGNGDSMPTLDDTPDQGIDADDGARAVSGELSSADFSTIDIVSAIERERDEMRDTALRLQADFENYRKRVTAQHVEDVNRATGKMAEALLPVLDACEAAFLNHPAEVEPLFNVLLGTLRKEGLEAMNLQDQAFDPAVAEAVIHEPADDGQEPTVTEVLRTGYTWKGRVLRPAMVKVRG